MKNNNQETSSQKSETRAPHGARCERELSGEHLLVEPSLLGLGQAKPEKLTGSHLHGDPPPAERSVKVGCR